ncbi:hypothetical protein AB4Y43_06595 [Paraburkholderia sp. BR10872]|uniref:hypothetical protein n=1 Tax=Paraburkholderia sp. BR10872 TaxID=3236989 RepID=UPI0034D290F3
MSHGTGFYAETEKLFRPAEHASSALIAAFCNREVSCEDPAILRDVGGNSRCKGALADRAGGEISI